MEPALKRSQSVHKEDLKNLMMIRAQDKIIYTYLLAHWSEKLSPRCPCPGSPFR